MQSFSAIWTLGVPVTVLYIVTSALELTPATTVVHRCRTPSSPRNGSVQVWGQGLLVEYTCDKGLVAIGSTFGSCNLLRKRWTIRRPVCVSSDCGDPDSLKNGKLYMSHGNAVATAICNPGYRLTGYRVRHCDGYRWQGHKPRCRDRYPSRKDKRQMNVSITTTTEKPRPKPDALLLADIMDADGTCYKKFTPPLIIDNAKYKIEYKYNAGKREWILIANYTCVDGHVFTDTSNTYLYCKEFKWVTSRGTPVCANENKSVDPCLENNGGCGHKCVPHRGGRYNCECRPGYSLETNIRSCYDINECALDNGGCAHGCENVPGSFFCTCRRGYLLSGDACLDVDECLNPGGHPCKEECINLPGSYECTCNRSGYMHSPDRKSCWDVDECKTNNGGCQDSCVNELGSYRCMCKRKGSVLSPDGKTCDDLDECQRYGKKLCVNGHCVNTQGSYTCTCNVGYSLDKAGQRCTDVNECTRGNGGCEHKCTNTEGSFTCSCRQGFSLVTDHSSCTDINECHNANGGCDDVCTNSIGSYECTCHTYLQELANDGHACIGCDNLHYYDNDTRRCLACPKHTSVEDDIIATSRLDCICQQGFMQLSNESDSCVDINECAEGFLICQHACVNTEGSAYCTCHPGYRLEDRTNCTDVDECSEGEALCSGGCQNLDGSYSCYCNEGYRINADRITCDDVDECYEGVLNCSHQCDNWEGGAACGCPSGFLLLQDNSTCIDVDECTVGSHLCDDTCHNTAGSYTCTCSNPGLKLSWDLASCVDINECMEGENECVEECVNAHGSYICACSNDGYVISGDGVSCEDVDECGQDSLNICEQTCINTPGSYHCDCRAGYALYSFFQCAPCPRHYYRTLDHSECIACPTNARTDAVAATDVTTCHCLPGYRGNVTNGENCVRDS